VDNEKRKSEHKKPSGLEQVLAQLADILTPLENEILSKQQEVDLPRFYIMGTARSGTTLIFQYLTSSGIFAYPTNLLSRFFYAPTIGALIQKALIEFDFNNEVLPATIAGEFESKLGKTKGPLSPHEFWYFWRRFFPTNEYQRIDTTKFQMTHATQFLKSIESLQGIYNKPFLMKGMHMNWEVDLLNTIDKNAFFINVFRDPIDNAMSLLEARMKYFGNYDDWYSFKPEGIERILHLSPEHQTLWQVNKTNADILMQMKNLSKENFINVNYEDFCKDPNNLLRSLSNKTNLHFAEIPFKGNKSFQISKNTLSDQFDWKNISQSISSYL
jgi:hypothetical protein